MTLKTVFIRLVRLVALYWIISLILVVITIAGLVLISETSAAEAIIWHLRHGNEVAFRGHTFRLPLLWNSSPARLGVEFSRASGLSDGDATISLESSGTEVSLAEAQAWQAEKIKGLSAAFHSEHIHGTVLSGRSMQFVCVGGLNLGLGDTYDCKVPGTNLTVMVSASHEHLAEATGILESAR